VKNRLALTLAACAVCVGAHAQNAHSTKTALVQATVLDTCRFEQPGASLTLSLGPLDPSAGTAVTQTQSVKFSCTNGYTMSVGLAGEPTQTDYPRTLTHTVDRAQTVPYFLSLPPSGSFTGRGFGAGNELTLNLLAQVASTEYANARGGAYEDTVVIELRP
jgi:spore coat protein U-like protein